MKRILGLIILFPLFVQAAQVKDVRVWPEPDNTRIVFDLSGSTQFHMFELDNPPRIVIDLKSSQVNANVSSLSWADTPVKKMRYATRNNKDIRLVLDLNKKVKPQAFTLPPNGPYGHRLVLDLHGNGVAPKPIPYRTERPKQDAFVIAVDAGHGGEDSGARGARGTKEKDIVLQIAKELYKAINNEPGMRAVLIRDGDYYVGLRQRILKARQHQADMFISIHADGFKDPRANGASVFTLSQRGSTSEAARWLAERENRSDLVGGVSLDDKDDVLAGVLLDLSQTVSKEASLVVGQAVLDNLGGITRLHGSRVQHAGFAVLKSPDIPSILVETEFISNPDGERKLRSKTYQRKVVNAIVDGVKHYIHYNAHQYQDLPILQTAKRTHKVRSGDTLSALAVRYGVSVSSLRSKNRLKNDTLVIGQVLDIP